MIVPIIKDKNADLNCPNNYRGIALSSVLGKLLENVILWKFSSCWVTSDQQFGFKKGHGCDVGSYVLRETVLQFLEHGNDVVFACFLDLSKAYDRVVHPLLFLKMLHRGTPSFLVRFLREWHKQQEVVVRWQSTLSSSFSTTNGVRQGSVLSPILFNLFIDDIVKKLAVSEYGPWINGCFCGCGLYADDSYLASPTRQGLQAMLDICGDFAVDNLMQFNITKSKVMASKSLSRISVTTSVFILNGQVLEQVEDFLHLGHNLSSVLHSDDVGVSARCRRFYSGVFGDRHREIFKINYPKHQRTLCASNGLGNIFIQNVKIYTLVVVEINGL